MTPDERRLHDERELWAMRFPRCWACGGKAFTVDTHEIVRRGETADWRNTANYVRLCRSCHEEAHGGDLSKGVILTLKLLFDPLEFDLDWILARSIRKGVHPEPLPARCRWMLSI